jgi:hypothetical protein
MTDLRKAAQAALEALTDMNSGWKYIRSTHGDLYGVGWDRADAKANDAIEALRAALAQPEQHEDDGDLTGVHGLLPEEGWDEAPKKSPTADMSLAQRILHVGGRNNAAGYVEFGSTQAVEALIRQVLRDLPAAQPQQEPTKAQPEQQPAAHMYPSDLEKFERSETFATAYSVAVGCPDEHSVPLYLHPAAQPQQEPARAT